jgi:hypothetical protein
MNVSERISVLRSFPFVRNCNGWSMLGYAIFGAVVFTAIYLASAGPEATDAGLAIAMAMP